jgi:hypothetical protein
MPDSNSPTAKSKREPAALSSEYHKAHKQLMLWATILFIWELVGVDLSKAKDAGGNVGPIVTALKSPQAVPWVLLILVLYFLFKCSVEWAQCHVDRRKVAFAKIDYVSALIVSGVAIILYIGQAVSRVQFANAVEGSRFESVILGGSFGGLCGFFGAFIAGRYSRRKRAEWSVTLVSLLVVFMALFQIWLFRLRLVPRFLWPAMLLGIALTGIPMFMMYRRISNPLSSG